MRLMPLVILIASAAVSIGSGASAFAGDKCAYLPRHQWMPMDRAISQAEKLGYQVRHIQVDDGCWEVEGFDRSGATVKVVLNPANGQVVKLVDTLSLR